MSERIVDDPSLHGWVEDGGKWVWDASGGGAGAGMVISETEPTDKVEGMQWLNPTTGLVLFWDDEKWLQMPTTGAAGKDGVDGVDGLWTDNGDTSISYTAGNVGIGTDDPQAVFQVVDNNPTAHSTTADADTNMPGMRLWNNAGGNTWSGVWFQNGSHWSGISGAKSGNGWGTHLSFFTHGEEISDLTQATERMRIDADGNVGIGSAPLALSGTRTYVDGQGAGGGFEIHSGGTRQAQMYSSADGTVNVGSFTDQPLNIIAGGGTRITVDSNGRVDITGSLYVNGTPKIGTSELIETLSTLRTATQDETVDVRQALASACDKLIEKFEAMQSTATQEINDE